MLDQYLFSLPQEIIMKITQLSTIKTTGKDPGLIRILIDPTSGRTILEDLEMSTGHLLRYISRPVKETLIHKLDKSYLR